MKNLFGEKIEKEDIDMNIEVVRLYRLEGDSPVKAFVDLQFGNDYVIKGFKVVESYDFNHEGLFVAMPSELGKNGKWFNTFLPLSDEIKDKITETILQAYQE